MGMIYEASFGVMIKYKGVLTR